MRRLTWRVPNVALVRSAEPLPVVFAEERHLPSSKRPIRIDLPPGTSLGDLEWLTGPDGSRWRIEMVSDSVAYAHEVYANDLPPSADGC